MLGLRLVLAAAGLVSAALAPYLHPHRLVDIGGRRINLYCTGSGSPTVILDNDGDDSTYDWRFVQPQIAKRSRVCSYDIAASGFSDPAPAPNDANAKADDLGKLLDKADVGRPIVLVSYGVSGLWARLYADRHTREVAGMVFVDPAVPYQHRRISAIAPALKAAFAEIPAFDRACWNAAARRLMRPGTAAFKQCMYTPPGPVPPAMRDLITHWWEQPARWQDYTLSDENADASSSEVRGAQHRYGSMPLIVLTSDMRVNLRDMPIPAAQKEALYQAWPQWHRRIAALSSRGSEFVVDGSTSNMSIDRPSAIVSAIDEVLDQARYAR